MSDAPANQRFSDAADPPAQDSLPGLNKPPRWQFSLRDILLLFFVVSLVLALTLQLHVLGGVLACYLAALASGLRFQHRGLASGAATACAVFVLAIGASWVRLGYASLVDGGEISAEQRWLERIAERLADYREMHGSYPETLDDLFHSTSVIGLGPPFRGIDPCLRYRRTSSGYDLVDLGSDRQPGGHGYNADIRPYESLLAPHYRLSFHQFLFNVDNYGSVLTPALLASVFAGQIVFSSSPKSGPLPATSFFRVTTIAIASVAVAVLLASIYLNQPRSGH